MRINSLIIILDKNNKLNIQVEEQHIEQRVDKMAKEQVVLVEGMGKEVPEESSV